MTKRAFLITQFCSHELYHGWHLYLRDSKKKQQRNSDGGWKWIRWHGWKGDRHPYQHIFDALEIELAPRSDGTCDNDGYAELARRFPIPRQRIGGKPRGCIEVEIVDGVARIVV